MDSGAVTSSRCVVFKDENAAALISAADLDEINPPIRTFCSECLLSTKMTAKRVEKTPTRGARSHIRTAWRKSASPGTAE